MRSWKGACVNSGMWTHVLVSLVSALFCCLTPQNGRVNKCQGQSGVSRFSLETPTQPEPCLGLTGPEQTQLQWCRVQKAICWDPQGKAHPVVRVPGAAAVGTPGAHRIPGSRGQRCLSDPQMQTKPLATLPGLGSLHSGVKWAQNWEEMWSRFKAALGKA